MARLIFFKFILLTINNYSLTDILYTVNINNNFYDIISFNLYILSIDVNLS